MLYVIYFAALVYLLTASKRRRIANLRARHQSFEK